MKQIIPLIFLVLVLTSCSNIEPLELQKSQCDSITDIDRKISCVAFEKGDLFLCSTIKNSGLKDDCIIRVAEVVKDSSQYNDCLNADKDIYKVTCQALIKKDIDLCFSLKDVNGGGATAMRDCVDLLARKLKQQPICQNFVTRAQEFFDACGSSTSVCEGLWLDGKEENMQRCIDNIGI
ncbi:hypothetical protein D6777_02750 [Candidatus Woesearchaeota archaeon]|nr:MAG: hypothetical protein D6777_02750 [Candidatus Woesearchaeota archaeon]